MNNPSDFNAAIHIVIAQGLNLVENKKMAVETMLGILECHKLSVFQWRMDREYEAQQQAAAAEDKGPPEPALIIHPSGAPLVR